MSQITCDDVDFDTPGDEIVVLADRIDEFQVRVFNVSSSAFITNTKSNAALAALALTVDIGQTTGPIPEPPMASLVGTGAPAGLMRPGHRARADQLRSGDRLYIMVQCHMPRRQEDYCRSRSSLVY
ncbi:MAG: hypothetical protein CMJ21_06770 [Phycisphaerae bacterium]|nr:hypothetical protein [Phycisphaerae bacterium]